MATANKFSGFTHALATKLVNLNTDVLKVMLTNTLPVATNNVYADVSGTELATGNGYTTGGGTVTGVTSTNATGTETVSGASFTWTSVTGTMGPFRYVVLYDSTATAGNLIEWWDYGSAVSLNGANGDQFTWTPTGSVLLTLV